MTEPQRPRNLNDIVRKVEKIHKGLEKNLASLRERISLLETDRAGLLMEIERLKKVAESRAGTLEVEIAQLHQEVKALKEILGTAE